MKLPPRIEAILGWIETGHATADDAEFLRGQAVAMLEHNQGMGLRIIELKQKIGALQKIIEDANINLENLRAELKEQAA